MHKTKKRAFALIFVFSLILFIFSPIFKPFACPATVMWVDDFDDGNYNGWTVQSGTFSAANHMLQATGEKSTWHLANRTNLIAYGTWSFDLYINTTGITREVCGINFLANSISSDRVEECYEFMVLSNYPTAGKDAFYLLEEVYPNVLGEYHPPGRISGWYHIDVTRDKAGLFYVFLNGSLIITGEDTTYTTSKYFAFFTLPGQALDNIVVDNEITVFPEPSNLTFDDESISVSCQQNGSALTSISVRNNGEATGSGTLIVGPTPNGITVTFDHDSIHNLYFGNIQEVTATIEASVSVTPGDYVVDVELHNNTAKLDTMQLAITVTGMETTTKTTDNGAATGIPILGVILVFGILVVFRRKQS